MGGHDPMEIWGSQSGRGVSEILAMTGIAAEEHSRNRHHISGNDRGMGQDKRDNLFTTLSVCMPPNCRNMR